MDFSKMQELWKKLWKFKGGKAKDYKYKEDRLRE